MDDQDGQAESGGKLARGASPSSAVTRRTRAWAVIALAGGLLLAITSIDSFEAGTSAGTAVGGAVGVLLALAIVASAVAVVRRGDVSQVALLGLLGAAAFGWQQLALAPVETAVLGGRPGLFDVSTAVSALAVLLGSVGVCLSTSDYRYATWESVGGREGRPWLMLTMGAAVTAVIALFLPYATYRRNADYPTHRVDAWTYFAGFGDTVILVLALSCGTLAALALARPQLPYRWPLAAVGVATLPYVFTPSEFGSVSQTGQALSLEVGAWLILISALVVSIAGVSSWRRSGAPDRRRSRN